MIRWYCKILMSGRIKTDDYAVFRGILAALLGINFSFTLIKKYSQKNKTTKTTTGCFGTGKAVEESDNVFEFKSDSNKVGKTEENSFELPPFGYWTLVTDTVEILKSLIAMYSFVGSFNESSYFAEKYMTFANGISDKYMILESTLLYSTIETNDCSNTQTINATVEYLTHIFSTPPTDGAVFDVTNNQQSVWRDGARTNWFENTACVSLHRQ
ncbi:hypothetical protein AX774_g7213 [Zancudomyces culisetae]|uniref:Uncharacterized protein n=1 Tax=Zancudomyces culisetae TaxID=1213189 RepID=A0A1R1PEJ1_ZANCU|nr:hypothetical protein AX774_g7213 [Zancudomyces culisetae]|eukprot:OMH79376.1 hypothetical protein AX774_g7213 [Zancudomyces culisetae]